MRTRISKALDTKIGLWETDGTNTTKVGDVWARVENLAYDNYNVAGQSLDLLDKKVICRQANLSTNKNAFEINGKLHQINRVEANYRESQFTYYLDATNFEL